MTKTQSKRPSIAKRAIAPTSKASSAVEADRLAPALALIEAAQRRVAQTVNAALVSLYWELGKFVCEKLDSSDSDDLLMFDEFATALDELATAIATRFPAMRGYTRGNLLRMARLYFDSDRDRARAPLARPRWQHDIIILGNAAPEEDSLFYLLRNGHPNRSPRPKRARRFTVPSRPRL